MGQTFSAGDQRNEQIKEVDVKDKGIEKDVILTRSQIIEEVTRKHSVEDSRALQLLKDGKDEEKHVLSQGRGLNPARLQRNEKIQEVDRKSDEKHVLSSLGTYSPHFQRNQQIQEVGHKDEEKHDFFQVTEKHIPPFQTEELIQAIDCKDQEERVLFQATGKYINKLENPTRKQNVEVDRRNDDAIHKVEIPTNKQIIESNPKNVAMNNNVSVRESLSMNMLLKHYNNCQRILLVGEGDFSFSASLVVAFGSSGSNIIATSHDSADFLRRNYTKAITNIENLTASGATVMLRLDATAMANHPYLRLMKFDRIIYNIPYFGFTGDSPKFQNRQQRKLVKGFLSNAKKMVKDDGEVHISTHQTNEFHLDLDVNGLALLEGLCLVREVNFNSSDYPGKDSSQCKTYMWRIVSTGPFH